MIIDKLKDCKILDYNYGFLGEIYIGINELVSVEGSIINKYFSLKNPYYCSRNKHYYSRELSELKDYYSAYEEDIKNISNSIYESEIKRVLLFTIINHLINDTAKLIGLAFAYSKIRSVYLDRLKSDLQSYTNAFVDICFGDKHSCSISIDLEWMESLFDLSSMLGIGKVREYSEMDHPLILILSFMVNHSHFKHKDVYVAPLQGSSIIPAMYVSLTSKIITRDNNLYPQSFSYLRSSSYDNTHHLDLSIEDQVGLLSNEYSKTAKVILIDDNVGTGTTMKTLKSVLGHAFDEVTTCVLECRWEPFFATAEYPSFDLNEIDLITPLEYRYYKRFDEEINHLKLSKDLNLKYYRDRFYKLNFVYNNHDFDDFLLRSNVIEDRFNRLQATIEKYKILMSHVKLDSDETQDRIKD